MRSRTRSDRAGVALAAAVVLMLTFALLAHAVLVMAGFEYTAARAAADQVAARIEAEAAVRAGVLAWRPVLRDSVARWAGTSPAAVGGIGGASYSFTRATREVWEVHGQGRRGPLVARAGALAWMLDPAARAAALPGAVVVESGRTGVPPGVAEGRRFMRLPTVRPAGGCRSRISAVDSIRGPAPLPATAALPPQAVRNVGMMPLDSLAARLPGLVAGVVSPVPTASGGVCDTAAPANWGDPRPPLGPCSAHRVSGHLPGPSQLTHGVGQGLLVVTGDLVLRDMDFFGLVVATGVVRAEAGSRIIGGVWALGGFVAEADVSVSASACWVSFALEGAALAAPFRPLGAAWLPAF